jgi:hypothetical protein
MCDTCPTHLLGPGEVAGKVARSKAGRKAGSVLFYGTVWTFGPLMIAGIIVYTLGWWLVPITLGLAALAAGVLKVVRILHKRVVVPAATPAQRVAELERRRRNAIPIPAARPALPRGLSVTRGRRALPAPAKALPAAEVVTGRVVPAPVHGKVVR